RAAGSAPPADAADDRERLRADRADRARRLGDRRGARGGPACAPARPRARLPGACGGDDAVKVVRTIADVREALRDASGVGLVPTMGAYHEGHLALFRAARGENEVVAASLFVNPAQFGPGEDFSRYPRDEERDEQVAAEAGVDLLFVPTVEEIYPEGFQTWVEVEQLSEILEGAHRPGHFRGVAT